MNNTPAVTATATATATAMAGSACSNTSTPIAIVGMGCRFAGDATSPQKLWEMVERGGSAWSKVPSSRFNVRGVYHPNGERVGSTHVKGGHFIDEDPALFDAAFFNMTTEVASCMDPQYRLMLEVVYESLESAGITIDGMAGSNTSVFGGVMYHDYQDSLNRDPETVPRYFITGNSGTMLSNRISHFYDLRGPSVTVDTACSTTLTALHLACQSLRTGESDTAIVIGANLLLNPDVFVTMSNLGFLSPDGISYSFDPRANGYGRGEGIAALVIKALPNALRDQDPIRAVIRETALNQDGKTPAITAPSDVAQKSLIQECYDKAGLDMSLTSYVEAHGTGTPTGDPLEISAISAAFKGHPLHLGSVKANIGHTEAASGLASIIKVALALEKGLIPPNARFLQKNSKLMLDQKNIKIPMSAQDWPVKDGTRRASVNNFGFGGSNAHVILESYDRASLALPEDQVHVNGNSEHGRVEDGSKQSRIYVVRAKDEQACRRTIASLRDYIKSVADIDGEPFLASLAYTLGSRRSILPWTSVYVADSLGGLVSALSDESNQPKRANEKVRLGFVFTGQGAQWHAMGRELVNTFPVFKQAILECDGYIKQLGASWNFMEELHRDELTTRVNDAEYSLPLSTAIQIALVRLLWSWGIRPTGITSHSSGEAAAAYAAGALSARSAIGITYIRGVLTTKPKPALAAKGGMMAVGLGRSETNVYISRLNQEDGCVVVGCINSQCSVTVSGDLGAIEKLEKLLHADGIFTRKLKVTEAFHSSHMRPMADAFGASLRDLFNSDNNNDNPNADTSKGVLYSSPKTGSRMTDLKLLLDPTHWMDSMLQPVEFESSLREMCFDPNTKEKAVDVIIEIGPHGALGGPINQVMQDLGLKGTDINYLSCLSRGRSSLETMYRAATELISKGYGLKMDAINFPHGRKEPRVKVLSDLPAYPWNHQTRYWREPRGSRESKQRTHPPHTLIGSRESLSPHFAPKWKHVLRLSDIPWIRDHVVGSSIIFPGAGFISMAIEGFSQVCPPVAGASINYNLRDVELAQALIIPADAEAEVDLRLTIRSCEERSLGTKNWHQFSVHSISGENNTWTEHCTGLIRSESERSHLDCSTVEASRRLNLGSDNRSIDPNDLWESLHANGICHGPIFQNIQRIQNNGQGSFCRFSIADTASAMPHSYENRHIVHPTTLDSVIQAAYTVLPYAGTRMKTAMVPRRLRNVKISSSLADLEAGDALDAQASIKDRNSQSFSTDLAVFDDYDSGSSPSDGIPVIEIEGLVFQSVGSSFSDQKSDSNDTENACSSWVWAPDISLGDSTWLKEKLSTEAETKETELMMDLRRCTINFIQEAVTDLTNSDIQHLDGHLQKYFDWMNVQLDLARQNKLSPASCDWLSDDAEQKKCLQARVAGESVNGEMISRLGPQLIAMLRRETEPLELMMQDQLLSRYYVNAIKWSRSNAQASELIRLCAHKNPRSRILEIGGGTGGCTKLIVNALGNTKPIDRYDFTDVSAGFFESAREQFADWQDVMTFKKLDIESDPEQQGFECATYDVVVACQVLHATRCMKRTLSNVRKLLKPGGNLILVETTRDQLDLFFTFGLLPGWWLSEEPERKSTPSLTTDLWNTMLDTSGFNGVELEVRDCEDDEFYMISTMLSTARKENTTPDTVAESEVLLLHGALRPPSSWLESLQAAICEKTSSSPSINALGEVDTTGRTCIFLGEMESSLLGEVGSETFKSITAMLNNCNALLWVSRGAAMSSEDPWKALHIGLLRTIRNENNGKEYVSLDLDPSRNAYTHESLYAICNIFNGRLGDLSEDKEFEFAERNGVIHVPRLFNDPHWKDQEAVEVTLQPFEQPGRRLRMEVETPGLLDSLQFRDDEGREGKDLPDDWVEIEPKAFGLNFRDVMVAMGQLEANRVMGFECAGVITKLGGAAAASQGLRLGDRVCALLKGHWATRTQTPYTNVVRIPDEMGFPEAASVPLAFTTAYIALYTTAKLRRGERVLIHSGAGGVGQAAIILSQLAGAEVFVTAGTQAKRDFVGDKFGINPDHIFSSRNDLFVDGIKAYTGGLGVHVVLNSLAGQLLQASFDCMAEFGRFVEIGKKDLEQNSRLDMLPFTRDVSFTSIDLLSWQRAKSEEVSEALNHVTKLLETKAIGLIGPIQQHSLSNIEKAFRTMQSGQHVGKVVVNVSGDELVPVGDGGFSLKLKPDSSYLVAGGLGGIGKQICQWLVDHGAKHLIILSRSAKASPFITSLQNQQCAVYLHACDISDQDQVTKVLRLCEEAHAPPIRGIIQGAMVLKDALLSRMTLDEFNAATRPKVQGSWYLHKIAQDVDFFVMLSSLVGVMGGAGQANYAAAGAFQDALAHHRRAHGMPAVTIDLGMVKSVGYVAETGRGVADRLARIGYKPMHEKDVMDVLEKAILCSSPQFPSPPAAVVTGINTSPGAHWTEANWIQEQRFVGLKYRQVLHADQSFVSSHKKGPDGVRAQLSRVTSHDEAISIVLKAMTEKLMRMFGLAEDDMSSSKNLAGVGVDSLVAIELRNWITSEIHVDVSIFELMNGNTIAGLVELVVAKCS